MPSSREPRVKRKERTSTGSIWSCDLALAWAHVEHGGEVGCITELETSR